MAENVFPANEFRFFVSDGGMKIGDRFRHIIFRPGLRRRKRFVLTASHDHSRKHGESRNVFFVILKKFFPGIYFRTVFYLRKYGQENKFVFRSCRLRILFYLVHVIRDPADEMQCLPF